MKIKLGVFFGGRSVEHEVSVITGIQAINNLDRGKYDPVPIYMARDGAFWTGEAAGKIEEYSDIPSLLKKCVRVVPVGREGRADLVLYPPKRFGKNIYDTLDAALPAVHGTNVEDGALQGFFRTIGLPFAGCDVEASALGMDKYAMKILFAAGGLPVLPGVKLRARDFAADPETMLDEIKGKTGWPAIIKPFDMGSSVGIRIAENREEARDALEYAFSFSPAAVAERAIINLREINCAVLGDADEARASECEEPVSSGMILSYEDKYVSGGKDGASKGMTGLKRLLPAPIPPEMREKARALAVEAFKALDCAGVARIDFLLDSDSGELYINEINTIPGSLAFYLWQPLGLSYSELLDEMVRLALKRERERDERSFSIDTGILKHYSGQGSKGSKR
ncbi:MAG: D-alanine--D-alanine ligase [Clostridiales bacterium]|nr:D-alanine--D-alanine ligase [Clostridiales bacterium]